MPLPAQTIKLFAYRYMRLATSKDIVQWAVEMLQEGFDTASLRIIAGLLSPFDWEEVEHYLYHAFEELGWKYPEKEPCLQQYARNTANAITTAALSPADGCREMYRIARELNFPGYLTAWFNLDEGLAPDGRQEATGNIFDELVIQSAREYIK